MARRAREPEAFPSRAEVASLVRRLVRAIDDGFETKEQSDLLDLRGIVGRQGWVRHAELIGGDEWLRRLPAALESLHRDRSGSLRLAAIEEMRRIAGET